MNCLVGCLNCVLCRQQSPNQFVNRTSLIDRQIKSAVTIEIKLPNNVSNIYCFTSKTPHTTNKMWHKHNNT